MFNHFLPVLVTVVSIAQMPALAVPTWLACSYSDGSGLFKVRVDEPSSSIEYIGQNPGLRDKTVYQHSVKGFYSPDDIQFEIIAKSRVGLDKDTYSINRKTLQWLRNSYMIIFDSDWKMLGGNDSFSARKACKQIAVKKQGNQI